MNNSNVPKRYTMLSCYKSITAQVMYAFRTPDLELRVFKWRTEFDTTDGSLYWKAVHKRSEDCDCQVSYCIFKI